MKYREDRYGNKLSVLGFGCMRFKKKMGRINMADAERQVMNAFNSGVSMEKITLHEGLKNFSKSAFENFLALTKINLPTTVMSISNAPFHGCESLSEGESY